MGFGRGCDHEPKSKRTSSPSSLKRSFEPLAGFRHEALEHRAATLFQERLGRACCDLLAGDGLPDRKLAPTLPAAAAVALCLIQDLRAAEGAWAQGDRSEARRLSSGPSIFGLAGGLLAPLRPCPPGGWPESRLTCPPPLPPDRNWDLRQLAVVEQLEDDLA